MQNINNNENRLWFLTTASLSTTISRARDSWRPNSISIQNPSRHIQQQSDCYYFLLVFVAAAPPPRKVFAVVRVSAGNRLLWLFVIAVFFGREKKRIEKKFEKHVNRTNIFTVNSRKCNFYFYENVVISGRPRRMSGELGAVGSENSHKNNNNDKSVFVNFWGRICGEEVGGRSFFELAWLFLIVVSSPRDDGSREKQLTKWVAIVEGFWVRSFLKLDKETFLK